MDLKARLAQLDRLTKKPSGRRVKRESHLVPFSLESRAGVMAELGLLRLETPEGEVWFRESCDSLPPPLTPVPDLTGLFSNGSGRPDVSDLLFLDTETTGLAGGTGTLVFQVGVSWWRGSHLITRQYFLPDPGHERALLAALADLAVGFRVVVTFNGASFDLPLLRTRALLNRLVDPCAALKSWDLLVPSRRLWGSGLPNCRQQTIERLICGRKRGGGDLDGARVPQAWFDFLTTGEAGLLPNVLMHNHRDMSGMAEIFTLICVAGRRLSALPETSAGIADDRAGLWAMGRICERRRDPEAAATCYTDGWHYGWGSLKESSLRRRLRQDAVRNLKRCQRWTLVEKIISDGFASGDYSCETAALAAWHREAAILYEHRLMQLDLALHHAVLAGDDHRRDRIQNRIARDQ